jgi:hypothetical protein
MDPDRRWSGPPLKRERPATSAKVALAKFEVGSNELTNTESSRILQWASRLDRIADFELQRGHIAIAERLSRQAAELRGARA